MHRVCLPLILSAVFILHSHAEDSSSCPNSKWSYANDLKSCYFISNETKHFDRAVLSCQKLVNTSHMLHIGSHKEQLFITELIKKTNFTEFFLGVNSLEVLFDWQWPDDAPMSYTNWNEKEPANTYYHECTSLDQKTGLWKIHDCFDSLPFICEINLENNRKPEHSPPSVDSSNFGCHNGDPSSDWFHFKGACYEVVLEPQTWSFANKSCGRIGGFLASLHSHGQTHALLTAVKRKNIIDSSLWIGLKSVRPTKFAREFQWINGDPVDFSDWDAGQPNDGFGNQDCVSLDVNTRRWMDSNCETKLRYICVRPDEKITEEEAKLVLKDSKCPNKFQHRFEDQCYQIFRTIPVNQSQADLFCQQLDPKSHLASVKNKEAQNFLDYIIGVEEAPDKIWNGLRHNFGGKSWSWTSGSSVQYFNLHSSSFPLTSSKTLCSLFVNRYYEHGTWILKNCSDTNEYLMCQISVNLTETNSTPTPQPNVPKCLNGWHGLDSRRCFQVFTGNKSNWLQARDLCSSYGGNLVAIHSAETNSIIENVLGKENVASVWIGLIDNSFLKFIWSTGEPPTFFNFINADEFSYPQNGGCVGMNVASGKWDINKCTDVNDYVCQRPRKIDTRCPRDYQYWNHSCFALRRNMANWHKARRACALDGAHMVSIHNDLQNNNILNLDNNAEIEIWLGLNALGVDEGFQWSDGTPLEFTNWASGNPNSLNEIEHCVTISMSDGKWLDKHCSTSAFYICQMSPTNNSGSPTPLPIPAEKVPIGNCPAGFFSSLEDDGKCFRIFYKPNERKSWSSAIDYCSRLSKKKAYLATLSSLETQVNIMSHFVDFNSTTLWIGMYRTKTDLYSLYRWADNSEVQFSYWDSGQPTHDQHTLDNCVHVITSSSVDSYHNMGKWITSDCSTPRGFICMTYKDPMQPTESPTVVNKCPTNFMYYSNNLCILTSIGTASKWEEAQKTCATSAVGGQLLTINSELEQMIVWKHLILTKTSISVWLGLRSENNLNSWVNHQPINFIHHSLPLHAPSDYCATIEKQSGAWKWAECTKKIPYLCEIRLDEKEGNKSTTTDPQKKMTCPDDSWTLIGRRNCMSVGKTSSGNLARGSLSNAFEECIKLKANLLSIHSEEEVKEVLSELKKQSNNGTSMEDRLWIGLYRKPSGEFFWMDKSSFTFQKWEIHEPPEEISDRDICVSMSLSSGRWAMSNCGDRRKVYVCSIPAQVSESETPTDYHNDPTSKHQNDAGLGNTSWFFLILLMILLVILVIVASVWVFRQRHRRRQNNRNSVINQGITNMYFSPSATEIINNDNEELDFYVFEKDGADQKMISS